MKKFEPTQTFPKDGTKFFMFFRRPTNWSLTGVEVWWNEGRNMFAGAGQLGECPKYAVGWTPLPDDFEASQELACETCRFADPDGVKCHQKEGRTTSSCGSTETYDAWEAKASECETCGGTGEIDEMLGGISTSDQHALCPDCT